MTPDISIYQWAIEEMSLSGKGVSLHPCSSSTMYKWARECNAILAREKAGWRVKANMKAQALDVVWLSPETVKIAVVGRAVSGKSALVNALGRRFDGLSILDMPYTALHAVHIRNLPAGERRHRLRLPQEGGEPDRNLEEAGPSRPACPCRGGSRRPQERRRNVRSARCLARTGRQDHGRIPRQGQ